MSALTVTVLGCGPSGGVPLVGCKCVVCTSAEPKNKRLRASILVEQGGRRILVDTAPDLRQQALRAGFTTVDAILFTHAHSDHCHGIDDARAFNFNSGKPVPIYGTGETLAELQHNFRYAFGKPSTTGVWYKPALVPITIAEEGVSDIAGFQVQSFIQHHGKGKSTGYRIGNFAYSTDVDKLDEQSLQLLEKLDVWLVDCLQHDESASHASLATTLEWIEKLKPKLAVLTHMSHAFDYATLKAELPPSVEPAYDGMKIVI